MSVAENFPFKKQLIDPKFKSSSAPQGLEAQSHFVVEAIFVLNTQSIFFHKDIKSTHCPNCVDEHSTSQHDPVRLTFNENFLPLCSKQRFIYDNSMNT